MVNKIVTSLLVVTSESGGSSNKDYLILQEQKQKNYCLEVTGVAVVKMKICMVASSFRENRGIVEDDGQSLPATR